MKSLALAALVALMVSPCLAKHAPLPEKLLTAKTIFVENHGGARLGDQAYAELTKWGRFQIVTDRAKADVVLQVSEHAGQTSWGQTQTYDPNMKTGTNTTGGWKYGTATSSSAGESHVSVLDAKTSDALYSNNLYVKQSLKDLRKRIEEQEKGGR